MKKLWLYEPFLKEATGAWGFSCLCTVIILGADVSFQRCLLYGANLLCHLLADIMWYSECVQIVSTFQPKFCGRIVHLFLHFLAKKNFLFFKQQNSLQSG